MQLSTQARTRDGLMTMLCAGACDSAVGEFGGGSDFCRDSGSGVAGARARARSTRGRRFTD